MSGQIKDTRPPTAAEVHRRIVDLENEGRALEGLAMVDPDVLDHRGGAIGDIKGITAMREKWEHMYDTRRDVSLTIEENVSDGEISANRYTLRATDKATGKPYEVTCLDMVRIRNGKMVEHWALVDQAAKRHQLGLDT